MTEKMTWKRKYDRKKKKARNVMIEERKAWKCDDREKGN